MKQWQLTWSLSRMVIFLVLVDLARHYCTATVINNKSENTTLNVIFTKWIVYFGTPGSFLMDNGGEFTNEAMRDLGDAFGIRLLNIAAQSPCSNGACKRPNQLLTISVKQLLEEAKCDAKVTLSWVVAVRNSLHNFSEFSPNQLGLGRNLALPNLINGAASTEQKSNSISGR